ncbi:hypothetical protein Tco_1566136, partial [Tanacetum coccineum]
MALQSLYRKKKTTRTLCLLSLCFLVDTQTQVCLFCECKEQTNHGPSKSSNSSWPLDYLGELWDCQLGNLTAGKGSGGGGEGLFMGELGLQGKRGEVNP